MPEAHPFTFKIEIDPLSERRFRWTVCEGGQIHLRSPHSWVRPRKGTYRDIGLREGRFTNEGMSDRPFQARFEAKMRSLNRLTIKVSQTSCRLVLERRGSESWFSGRIFSVFTMCYNRLSKLLRRNTYLCRNEPNMDSRQLRCMRDFVTPNIGGVGKVILNPD
jgi:hypothetical protein